MGEGSGINMVTPRLDDTASIDGLIDERDYPGLTCKLRKYRVYTIGDLRRRDVHANLTDWVGDSWARAIKEMLDENDGCEP